MTTGDLRPAPETPFNVNELTHAVNPIKLREYLAGGLPVVSTPMPEVKRYEHLVAIADSADTFTNAIESALAADSAARHERSEAMSCETWPAKVDRICEQLAGSATPSPRTSDQSEK